MSKRMKGRWMFDFASSEVCSRSTSFLRDVTWLRPRAGRKARDELVQLRDLLFALRVLGFDARADLRLGEHHVVVAAGVGDDGLVIDVGDVRADAVQEMAVVRDHDQAALVAAADNPAASGPNRDRGGWSARRAAAPADCRTAPAPAARGPSGRPAVRSSCARAALRRYPRPSSRMAASALGGVAAFFADDAFELAEAHAVFIGQLVVRLGVEGVALLQAPPTAARCP